MLIRPRHTIALAFCCNQRRKWLSLKRVHTISVLCRGGKSPWGQNHPEVANSLCNLAYLTYYEQAWPETLALLQAARAIMLDNFGSWHRDTLKVQQYIAETLRQLGDLVEAEKLLLTILPLAAPADAYATPGSCRNVT